MANTSNAVIISTANTFNHWRIRDNLVANDVNEIARGDFVKPTGNVSITEGRLVLANTTGGTTLEVKDDARVDGTVSTRNIEEDAAGYVYLSGGDITMGNRAAGGLFQANINTFFNSANVTVSNVTVGGTFNVASNTTITATNVSITNTSSGTLNVGNRIVTISTPNVLISNTDTSARFNVYPITHFFGGLVNVANTDAAATFNVTPNTFIFANANVTGTVNVTSRLEVLSNTFLYANLAVSNNATVSWNVTSGNVIATQNTSSGNVAVSQNTSTGNLSVTQNTVTGNLSVTGTANIAIGNTLTLFVQDLTVQNPIAAPAETTASQYRLRVSQASRADGYFGVNLGSTANGNAWIRFDTSAGNVWRETANSTEGTYYTLLSVRNLVTSTACTSTIDVSSANTVNSVNTLAGSSFAQANLAYAQANTSGNLVAVYANDSLVIANANVNFNNTSSVNVSSSANGTTQRANISFSVNTSSITSVGTLTSLNVNGVLNVTSNIANTGNIAVTQNVATGNIEIAQNTSTGNISVTQNVSTGNITVTQNASTGNISVTQNVAAGNVSVTQNVAVGNVSVTQNVSVGNVSVTQNVAVGNVSFTGTMTGVLKSYKEFAVVNTNVNGANTVDLSTANFFQYTLTGNPTFTFRNAPTSNNMTFNMVIIQDGSGNRVISWANTVYWAGGQVPPATTTAGARDVWQFITYDGGTTYIGTLAVKDAR